MSEPRATFDALPERLILKLDRGYAFLMWLGSLAFLAGGIFLVQHPQPDTNLFWIWVGILFFGLCAALFTLELMSPRLVFIELTRAGLRIVFAFRGRPPITPWNEIASIEVYRWWPYHGLGWRYSVRVRYVDDTAATSISPRIYGWGAEELAALLNRFRDRALRSDG